MKNYKRVLRQVGILWIVFGVLDIIYFVYNVTNHKPSSQVSLNIGFMIVGVALVRGHLKVASWIGDVLPFFLVISYGISLTGLLMKPPGLWMVELRKYPIQSVANLLFYISQLVILCWTYKQLRSRVVLKARAAASMDTKFPKVAFALVTGLAVFLAFWMHSALHGKDGAEAKRLAQVQLGEQYAYHVVGIRWSGNSVSANVVAYSDTEILHITVNWSKENSR
ncbi:MAG: hypothetical protein F6K28_17360 [Microcoleus sp. SIO2G3]|nr:hypothetical protein [Microcoleus sp. SIO2G3]